MKQIEKMLISVLISISILASIGIASAAGSGDRLNPGNSLNIGQYIISQNGQFKLIMQGDGNLVLYDLNTGKPLWATGTDGKPVLYAIMQGDGNLVLYGSNYKPFWDSKTWGHPGAWLIIQDDGNVVIFDTNGKQLFTTNTGKPTQTPPFNAVYGKFQEFFQNLHNGVAMTMTIDVPVTSNVYISASGFADNDIEPYLQVDDPNGVPDWAYTVRQGSFTIARVVKLNKGTHQIYFHVTNMNDAPGIYAITMSAVVSEKGNLECSSSPNCILGGGGGY